MVAIESTTTSIKFDLIPDWSVSFHAIQIIQIKLNGGQFIMSIAYCYMSQRDSVV